MYLILFTPRLMVYIPLYIGPTYAQPIYVLQNKPNIQRLTITVSNTYFN